MNIAEQAFNELFPDKDISNYEFVIGYTDRFKAYNANVKYSKLFKKKLEFSLSKMWKNVDKDIVIGLLQELMLKVFKKKKSTTKIDLYNIFLQKVHMSIPKTRVESDLLESFNRVNEKYFYGMIEQPNLIWGRNSFRKLGSYEYGTDTISISRIFEDDKELIDYIMYHEVLHKKHKFKNKNGRNYHHTRSFRSDERIYFGQEEMEERISKLIRRKRLKQAFFK